MDTDRTLRHLRPYDLTFLLLIAMHNTELTLDHLSNVSGAAYRRDFCIDPLLLKLILSDQKIPTILKGKSIHSRFRE